MKKVVLLAFVLMLLSTVVVVRFVRPVAASLPVHNIDTGLDYATIQEAIDAPETLDGHTILVDAGTYYESVTVNKFVTLIGENRSNTIIDGKGSAWAINIIVNDVEVTGFTIQNASWGVWIERASNISIYGNTISKNRLSGVSLYRSNNNKIDSNEITLNYYYRGVCNPPELPCYTGIGIALSYSNENTVIRNNVSHNYEGITSFSSNTNKIYHNNFINNTIQTQVRDSTNTWDNGSEGNYWSNYNGTDKNGDGIGDTPYVIDADNQDNYPLVSPYSLIEAHPQPPFWTQWWFLAIVATIIILAGAVYFLKKRKPPTTPPPPSEGTLQNINLLTFYSHLQTKTAQNTNLLNSYLLLEHRYDFFSYQLYGRSRVPVHSQRYLVQPLSFKLM